MASRVPRQDRGETRRAALVAAAVAVVSEHGPAGVLGESRCRRRPTCRWVRSATTSPCWTTCWVRHWPPSWPAGSSTASPSPGPTKRPRDRPGRYGHRRRRAAVRRSARHSRIGTSTCSRPARNPVAAAAMAALRPELKRLIARILISTRVSTSLTPDALLALLDGAAVGAIAEGSADPRRAGTDNPARSDASEGNWHRWSGGPSGDPVSERPPRDPFVGLDVPRPGRRDDVVGQRRWRRVGGPVPAGCRGGQPVPDVLLVERRLQPPRACSRRRARTSTSPGSAPRRPAPWHSPAGRIRPWCRPTAIRGSLHGRQPWSTAPTSAP